MLPIRKISNEEKKKISLKDIKFPKASKSDNSIDNENSPNENNSLGVPNSQQEKRSLSTMKKGPVRAVVSPLNRSDAYEPAAKLPSEFLPKIHKFAPPVLTKKRRPTINNQTLGVPNRIPKPNSKSIAILSAPSSPKRSKKESELANQSTLVPLANNLPIKQIKRQSISPAPKDL